MAGEEERELRRRLAEAGVEAPVGDPEATWQRAARRIRQRRRRRALVSAASLAVAALAGAAAVPPVWEGLREPRPDVVLEPAPREAVEPDAATWADDPETPDEAPPEPPVEVPRDWRAVDLGGAFVWVPPEWREVRYALEADDGERACPEGEPAVVVADDALPAGCPPQRAGVPEGLVVAPANVAHEAVGAVAVDGFRVSLPAARGRGLAVDGSPLLRVAAGPADRDLLVLPAVGDGLLVEAVGGDGAVEALAAGDDLTADPAFLDERARTVRRVLASLRPTAEPDPDALAIGRHRDRVASVDAGGAGRLWHGVPAPVRAAAVPDRATGRDPVAAVHAGENPPELLVLAGVGDDVAVVHRTPAVGDAPEDGDHPEMGPEAVWAEDRPYVAWLQPAEAGVELRVLGWSAWEALRAGDEPDTDAAVALDTPGGLTDPLAPVSWHEHAEGRTTLELGVRSEPEGFSQALRWGLVLPFEDGRLEAPPQAGLQRLDT